jgi:hypothetical protein
MTGDSRVPEKTNSCLRTPYAIVDLRNHPETATARMPHIKVGVILGLSFSILFSSGLYTEFRTYDPSLKLMLVVFVFLLCLTFLLLLERHTLIGWLQLASITFLVSFLAHQVVPNPAYRVKAQSALNYFADTSEMASPNLDSMISAVSQRATALTEDLSEKPNTLVEVRRETELRNADGVVAERIPAGTWAVLSGATLEDSEKRFTEVEILDEEGKITQVGYLDESDLGLKVIFSPKEQDD